MQVHVRGELQRLGHTVTGPLSAAVAQHYDELDPAWDTHSVQRRAAAVAHRIATGDDLPLSPWHELTHNEPDRASALRILATVELQRAQYPTMPLTAEDFAHAYDRLADTWHAQPLGDQATALAHRIRTGTDLPPHALTPTTPGRAGAVLDHDHAQRLDLTVRAELAAAGHPAQDLTPGRALVLHHFLDPAWHTTSPGHQAEAVARWIRTETRPGPPAQTRTTPTRPATMSTPALLTTGTSTETSAADTNRLRPSSTTGEADLQPAVDYAMVHPEDQGFVVESSAGERLWRFSDREPEEIFVYGFVADDPSSVLPLGAWVTDDPYESPYVSTTRNRNLWFQEKRYRYRIETALNSDPIGINVVATLTRQKEEGFPLPADVEENFVHLRNEAEVSFTGAVQPQAVVSVYDRVADRTGVYNRATGTIVWSDGELDDGQHVLAIGDEPPPYTAADVAPAVLTDGLNEGTQAATAAAGQHTATEVPAVPTAATGVPDAPYGAGEVRTDRWIPFGSRRRPDLPQAFAFTLAEDGALLSVRRPPGSGERTEVGYAWTWYRGTGPAGDVLHLTRRIHLRADGASPAQLRAVREGLADALDTHVNERGHRLPLAQADRVTGPVPPGPVLRVSAHFTDDPETAHTVVTVRPGLPMTPHSMEQSAWYTDVYPIAWVHEFVHGLGVWDDDLDSRALLAPGGRAVQVPEEGDSSMMGPLTGSPASRRFRLTPDHLAQIAAVFAPYAHAGGAPVPRGEVVGPAGAHAPDFAAAVDYDLIHPDDADLGVEESKPTETLWRFSDRSPESVFVHGFHADDVTSVVPLREWAFENPDAQFVSTTRRADLWYNDRRYRYRVDPARNSDTTGVDVNSTFAAQGDPILDLVDHEAEVAFTRALGPEAIVSVYDRQENRTGTWDPVSQAVVWRAGGRHDWQFETPPPDTAPAVDYTMAHPDGREENSGRAEAAAAFPKGRADATAAFPKGRTDGRSESGPVDRAGQDELVRQVAAQLGTWGILDRYADLPDRVARGHDAMDPAWRSQPVARRATLIATWIAVAEERFAPVLGGSRNGSAAAGRTAAATGAGPSAADRVVADRTAGGPRRQARLRAAAEEALRERSLAASGASALTAALTTVADRTWHQDWPAEEVARLLLGDLGWAAPDKEESMRVLTRPENLSVLRAVTDKYALGLLVQWRPALLKVLTTSQTWLTEMRRLSNTALLKIDETPGVLDILFPPSGGDGARELVEALDKAPNSLTLLLRAPSVLTALKGNVARVLAVTSAEPTVKLLVAAPALAPVLLDGTVDSAQRFAHEWALNDALLDAVKENGPGIDYRDLLNHAVLRGRIRLHADQASILVTSPQLLRTAKADPGVLGLLAGRPGLVDVLEDVVRAVPAFVERLAADRGLLEAAVANPAVTEWLSLDPAHFAEVPDDALPGRLRDAPRPAYATDEDRQPASAGLPGTSGTLLEAVRAASPGLDALLTREPALAERLAEQQETPLLRTLAQHPGLLSLPHEFRRLLGPKAETLRAHLREDSPLLAPHLLRAALRHEWFRWWMAESGPSLSTAPAADRRRMLAREAEREPALGELAFLNPVFGRYLSTSGENGTVMLDAWRVRLTDERPLVHAVVPGFKGVVARITDVRALLDVVFHEDAALVRLKVGTRSALDFIDDEAVALLRAHPDVLPDLAARPALPLSRRHWQRLLHNGPLLAALSTDRRLLNLLASAPEAFAEAIARPGFVDALGGEEFSRGLDEVVASKENSRSAKHKKNRSKAWKTDLVRLVQATGAPVLSAQGIELAEGDPFLAGLWQQSAEQAEESLAGPLPLPWMEDGRQELLRVHAAVRADRTLLDAARRSEALGAGLFTDAELAATVRARPRLLDFLLESDSNLLAALRRDAVLTAALRTHDALYEWAVTAPEAPEILDLKPVLARQLAENRELIGFAQSQPSMWQRVQASPVLHPLVHGSETATRLFTDGHGIARLLLDDEAAGLLGALGEVEPADTRSAVFRAVISGLPVARALVEAPGRVSVLAGVPGLAAAVADRSGVFADAESFGRFLDAGHLAAALRAHPEQAATVLGSPELLETALLNPRVVPALAADGEVARLLTRRPETHRLLREQPDTAVELADPAGSLRRALYTVRGLAGAMADQPRIARELRAAPSLVTALLRSHGLLDQARENGPLWRAARAGVALADALSPDAVRDLAGLDTVLQRLADLPEPPAGPDTPELRRLLGRTGLLDVLNDDAELAERFLATPAWRARALDDLRFTEDLRRLARDPERLQEAVRAESEQALLGALDALRDEAAGHRGRPAGGPARRQAGDPAPAPTTGTAPQSARSPWARTVEAHPEVGELLLDPAAAELAGRLDEHPDLALLLREAHPTVVDTLVREPDAWRDYALGASLGPASAEVDGARDPVDFESAFAAHLERTGLELSGELHRLVGDAARTVWTRSRSARDAPAADGAEVARRLAAFRANDHGTWTRSARVGYAGHVTEGSFTPADLAVLHGVARGDRWPRENRKAITVNQALHVHLEGGRGASLAFVLDPASGMVDLLVYAVSEKREGDKYRWRGHGTDAVPTALQISAVADDPAVRASVALAAELAGRTTEQVPEASGARKGKDGAGPAQAGDPRRDSARPGDPGTARLAAALRAYHEALADQRTAQSLPHAVARARARAVTNADNAVQSAVRGLRQLGLDPAALTGAARLATRLTRRLGVPAPEADRLLVRAGALLPAPPAAPHTRERAAREAREAALVQIAVHLHFGDERGARAAAGRLDGTGAGPLAHGPAPRTGTEETGARAAHGPVVRRVSTGDSMPDGLRRALEGRDPEDPHTRVLADALASHGGPAAARTTADAAQEPSASTVEDSVFRTLVGREPLPYSAADGLGTQPGTSPVEAGSGRPASSSTPSAPAAPAPDSGPSGAVHEAPDMAALRAEVGRQLAGLGWPGSVDGAEVAARFGELDERARRLNTRGVAFEIAGRIANGGRPLRMNGGAVGVETEMPRWRITFPRGFRAGVEMFVADIARSRSFRVVVEDWDTAAPFLEVVSEPLAVVDGDAGRVDVADYIADYMALRERLATLTDGARLSEAFPPAAGFRVWAPLADARLSRVPGIGNFVEPQFTVGIPVSELHSFLQHVRDNGPDDSDYLRQHIDVGLGLGTDIAAAYLRTVLPGVPDMSPKLVVFAERSEAVSALRGFVALAYTQIAAHGYWHALAAARVPGVPLAKNMAAALSRTDLAGIRAGLPPEVRAFLAARADTVKQMFVQYFSRALRADSMYGGLFAGATEFPLLEVGAFGSMDTSIGEYLSAALTDVPAPVLLRTRQDHLFRMRTRFPVLDTNNGRLRIPLVPVELRFYGPDRTTDAGLLTTLDAVVARARSAYDSARDRSAVPPRALQSDLGTLRDLATGGHPETQALRALLDAVNELEKRLPRTVSDGLLLSDDDVRRIGLGVLAAVEIRTSPTPHAQALQARDNIRTLLTGFAEHLATLDVRDPSVSGTLSLATAAARSLTGLLAAGGGNVTGRHSASRTRRPEADAERRSAADVAPAVDLGMVHPDDREFLVESGPGEVVWRWSDRSPDDVFREGFVADSVGARVALWRWTVENTPESPYVSTTRNRMYRYVNKRYRYTIATAANGDRTGVDVTATIARQQASGSVLPDGFVPMEEDEIAFTHRIAPEAIIGVFDAQENRHGYRDGASGHVVWSGQEVPAGPPPQDQLPGYGDALPSYGDALPSYEEQLPAYPDTAPASTYATHGAERPVPEIPVAADADGSLPRTAPSSRDGAGTASSSGRVDTERWVPFGRSGAEAFVIHARSDGSRRVTRPAASGELTRVGYTWRWHTGPGDPAGHLHLTRRIHLRPDGTDPHRLELLKREVRRAVDTLVNRPGYRLPVPGLAAGDGPVLRLEADFVDESGPDHADTVVTVRPGVPGEREMVQNVWYTDVRPEAYVHEIVHGLGVRDDRADPRALLVPGGRTRAHSGPGTSSLMGPFTEEALRRPLVLTGDHLRQIAEVFAPHARPPRPVGDADDRVRPGADPAVESPQGAAESAAEDFERRLGAHHHHDPAALAAARAAVGRMREVLRDAFPEESEERVADAFFTDDPTSAGQIGRAAGQSVRHLEDLLADGSVRELLTAYLNALGGKSLYENDPGQPSFTRLMKSLLPPPSPGEGAAGRAARMARAARLGLDVEGLRAYDDFLHGGPRARWERAVADDPALARQKHLFSAHDPIALGNLAAFGPDGRDKDPLEVVRSQNTRVPRSERDRATGDRKSTPRHYSRLGVPLSSRERAFLVRRERALTLEGFTVDDIPLDTLTFDPTTGMPDLAGVLARPDVISVEVHRAPAVREATQERAGAEPAAAGPVTRVAAVLRQDVTFAAPRDADLGDDAVAGPEMPVGWVEGTAYHDVDTATDWYREWHGQRNMPVVAGVSGTTLRSVRAFQWLNVADTSVADFRRALLAWMLPGRDHSLFEIVRGFHFADVATEREERATRTSPADLYTVPTLVPVHLRRLAPGSAPPTGSASTPRGGGVSARHSSAPRTPG
ncbi:hypothetical protein ACFY8B_34100 [Streptomyces sp. NPDC012751]|uniref:scabin-related ADP-ribosyltransferase n=1 Tax=Streptomyces sp. NPDC012751 TaxID=3364846 RepID=UPI0036747EAB